jgi:hypothetical protein
MTQAAAAVAQEQPWLADRRYREGAGYRTGNLELHPGIAGEFGYDSNMFLRAKSEDPIDVMRLRITPSLSLSTLGQQRRVGDATQKPPSVDFRADLAGVYNEYIATDSANRDTTSDFRNVGALAGADLHILPQRPWGARLFGNLTRTIQPSNLSDTSAAYNRIHAGAGGELIWAPGGGLFDWRAGYEWGGEFFEESRFDSLNNQTHTVNTRGRWRFLPRTALMFDASQGFVRYSDAGASAYLLDSDPLRARIGVNGLVSNHLALLALAGWGASFYKAGSVPTENYDGPIGQLQLTFYPTPAPGLSDSPREASLTLSTIALGYTRDFQNSYLGGFYSRDRGYLNVSYFFAGRVLLGLEGGISRVHFPTLYYPTGNVRNGEFDETRYDGSLFAEYRVLESVGINATLAYEKNDSILLPANEADPAAADNLSYDRFQGYVGLRWFM